MNIDELLYQLPVAGAAVRRLYEYFKRHMALTDFFHVLIGLGLGLMIAEGAWFIWGVLAVSLGILFHLYAFVKGK